MSEREVERQLADAARFPIVQFGLGLDTQTMARVDRLRACMGISRTRIIQRALMGHGLSTLERQNAGLIERFDALASRAGQGWVEYARAYAEANARRTFPDTVEDLETKEKVANGQETSDFSAATIASV